MEPSEATAQRDLDGIVAAASDYVESWLDGDPDRMASCLHPDLAKRARVDPGADSLALEEAPFEHMLEASRDAKPYDRSYEVEVLDIFDGIATAKVLSAPFMDYLHLARFGDRWLIVNVLYEERTDP